MVTKTTWHSPNNEGCPPPAETLLPVRLEGEDRIRYAIFTKHKGTYMWVDIDGDPLRRVVVLWGQISTLPLDVAFSDDIHL